MAKERKKKLYLVDVDASPANAQPDGIGVYLLIAKVVVMVRQRKIFVCR